MAFFARRYRLAGLVGIVLLAGGCNLISMPYFLLFGAEDDYPPEFKVFDNPKKEIKVALLANVGPETPAEFLRTDRDLSELLTRYLRQKYKETKTKIVMVPPNQVENYKDKHPNWQMELEKVGTFFHADYLVIIDLDKLSLFEPKSLNEWFRGHADVSISVVNVEKLEEGPVERKELTIVYPTHGPKSVMDNPNPIQFRADFIQYMVGELSRYFASYTMEKKYSCE
jgi:hypothetical protein